MTERRVPGGPGIRSDETDGQTMNPYYLAAALLGLAAVVMPLAWE